MVTLKEMYMKEFNQKICSEEMLMQGEKILGPDTMKHFKELLFQSFRTGFLLSLKSISDTAESVIQDVILDAALNIIEKKEDK